MKKGLHLREKLLKKGGFSFMAYLLATTTAFFIVIAIANARSCFGGEKIAFSTSVAGGVAPVQVRATVRQGDIVLFESENYAQEELRATALELDGITEIALTLTATDALGETATAEAALPCAVRATETRSSWERSVSNAVLTGNWPEDLLSVARTQLGYEESKINFIIDQDGLRKGYTRYGHWYGANYRDWCAMYASFCLNYANIPESGFPREAKSERWIGMLSDRGLYAPANQADPQPGDLMNQIFGEMEKRICR